jgi:branched-chain amino acid transport system substrate-binding protein
MKKKVFIAIGVVAIIAIGVVFYLNKDNGSKVTNIGVILPLSGDASVYGKNLQNGIELALEEGEKNNLSEMQVKLIYEDSKVDPKLAVNAFQKLSTIDKCKIVLGGFSSSEVLSMAPIAEKNKIILISPTASSPNITDAGDYIFRTTPSDNFDGEIMAKFAFNELKLKNIAIIYSNNDYGQGISKVFIKKFTDLGGEISAERSFESGANDFKSQLTALKVSHPDGLYIIAASEIGTILKQKAELNLNDVKIFTVGLVENPMVIEIAGNAANNTYYSYPSYQINSDDKTVKDFIAKFKAKYGTAPDVLAAYGYDLMNITLLAIKNGNDADKIKTSLYNLKDFNGVTGETSFDSNGDISKSAGIKIIENGEFKWFINRFN